MHHLPLFSPLEQFELFPGLSLTVAMFMLSRTIVVLSNLDFSFGLALGELLGLKLLFVESRVLLPSAAYTLVNSVFVLALGMVIGMVGYEARQVLPLVLTLFFFILVLNVLGLVPFGFCVTSQLVVTQFLGFISIGGLTLKGLQLLGFRFLNLFVPRNVPVFMLPFLSVIEMVSFVSRTLSLSIRLFANMVAGHALLHILMGALLGVFALPTFSTVVLLAFLLPTLLILAIFLLELGIAFLQAYVFVVLFLIYLNDSYRSH